jgi:hypothetical protein
MTMQLTLTPEELERLRGNRLDELLIQLRLLLTLLNADSASGLMARDSMLQVLRVDQLLRRIERDADRG